MTKILGINTATTSLSIALISDIKVLFEKNWQGPTFKAEQLTPWIQEALFSLDIQPKDLTGIGVAVGPGAFTGLRIGVTTAKTMAQMLNIPLVGLSTLEAFAFQYFEQKPNKPIRVLLNACRNELNTALFSYTKGSQVRLEEDHAEVLEVLLEKTSREDSLLIGDVPEQLSARKLPGEPSAIAIANLARTKIKTKEYSDPELLMPVYSHGPNIVISPRIHNLICK